MNTLNATRLLFLALPILWLSAGSPARAHCEIPCGIYGDELRFKLMSEHVDTIEKSMKQIVALSGQAEKDHNQIVRWVTNKDEHAEKLQTIVSQYFLHQRVIPVANTKAKAQEYAAYVKQLTLAHGILVTAMKAKQSTDLSHVGQLRRLLREFRKAYMGKKA